MKCELCGCENIVTGRLQTGAHGIAMVAYNYEIPGRFFFNKKVILRFLDILTCDDCGHILSLKVVPPEISKITK